MLVLDFINVGNGDSILVREMEGERLRFSMLVDCGHDSLERDDHPPVEDPRSCRIFAGDFLRSQGVAHLDILLVTHFHRDHIGGLGRVLEAVTVGDDCHIGAGAVLAGVVEPASATPVVVEDGVLVGANAVVIEGVRIGAGAVVAAGAVVTENVPPNAVVAGTPARIIKMKDARTEGKTALVDALRSL